jgi:HD-GYP domain-containing protein (c-di-GMP phosphodiesterase class II)
MTSHRPYRASFGIAAALDEIRSGTGTRYADDVVNACEQLFGRGFDLDAS